MEKKDYSPLALAYLGDAHFTLTVRRYLLDKEVRMEKLQKAASNFEKAASQARYVHYLLENGLLTPEEEEIYRWGRNSKSHKAPRSTDAVTYHVATGFETLWGYLYLNGNETRLEQLWDIIRTMEGE